MSKKNTLLRNTSVLMIATIVSRVIGLLYRSPLGVAIGNEGLGYYSTASNLYTILLLISSYSIPMAVSKIVSERLALKEYRNAHRVFYGALIYAVIVGGVAALVAFFGGKYLLPYNQQNALLALRVLAPTIFLSAILGVLRGYFQAHNTMMPTSISQIVEQILNAIVSIAAAYGFISIFASDVTQRGIYGAAGGTLGTGAGVLAGLVFMLIVYGVNRKRILHRVEKDTRHREETYGEIFQVLFLMVTPVIFTTFIYNCNSYVDNYLYFTILGYHGVSKEVLNASYGEFSNYYVTLINVPLAMASASASAMMPEVSSCHATGNLRDANKKILETIRLTMFISIPAAVGLGVLCFPITGVLFPSCSELSGKLLMVGSISVVFSALSTITNSALQSIGMQKIALRNAAISLVVNIVSVCVILFLFPGAGIYGVQIACILFSVSMCVLNNLSIRKYLKFKNEFKDTYLKPLAAAAIMGVITWIVYYGLFVLIRRPSICMVAAIVIAVLVYMVAYVVVTGTTESEMKKMPMGTKLVKVLRILHVYR
ncbi:MAG: polysaccharide biosynthesis protein [Fusicatenibacter sp.]|nr:polysaccharide biosynthesis protein [Lachnospiraceae bacterium]MDY2939074.1 polysaccharide biosynthesis protein [Fusicatenibacter sp.]